MGKSAICAKKPTVCATGADALSATASGVSGMVCATDADELSGAVSAASMVSGVILQAAAVVGYLLAESATDTAYAGEKGEKETELTSAIGFDIPSESFDDEEDSK